MTKEERDRRASEIGVRIEAIAEEVVLLRIDSTEADYLQVAARARVLEIRAKRLAERAEELWDPSGKRYD